MRVGILSTASIVPRFIQAFRETGGGEILAVASRSEARAAEFAAAWDIPRSYGSYESLLEDPEVDLVYIAMVSGAHTAYTLRALECGKHVICEKPFALTRADAEQMFRTAAEHGRFLAEAQKAVFLPVTEAVRSMIAEGVLGRIQYADFTSSFSGSYNSWIHSGALGGGALFSNGGYSVSLAQYLFGEAESYTGLCTRGESDTDEQCAFCMRMASGVLVTSRISTVAASPSRALICGDLGYAEIPDFWKAQTACIRLNSGKTIPLSFPCRHELVYELRHFLSCIGQGLVQSPVLDARRTIRTAEILQTLHDGWSVSR